MDLYNTYKIQIINNIDIGYVGDIESRKMVFIVTDMKGTRINDPSLSMKVNQIRPGGTATKDNVLVTVNPDVNGEYHIEVDSRVLELPGTLTIAVAINNPEGQFKTLAIYKYEIRESYFVSKVSDIITYDTVQELQNKLIELGILYENNDKRFSELYDMISAAFNNGTLPIKPDWNKITNKPTSAEYLNMIKGVDGAGSGLDADLFQGKDPNKFMMLVSPPNSVDPSSDKNAMGLANNTMYYGFVDKATGYVSSYGFLIGYFRKGDNMFSWQELHNPLIGKFRRYAISATEWGPWNNLGDAKTLDGKAAADYALKTDLSSYQKLSDVVFGEGTTYGYVKWPNGYIKQWKFADVTTSPTAMTPLEKELGSWPIAMTKADCIYAEIGNNPNKSMNYHNLSGATLSSAGAVGYWSDQSSSSFRIIVIAEGRWK